MADGPHIEDFVVELIGIGINGIIATAIYSLYNVTNSAIRGLKNAPSIDISKDGDLASLIKEHEESGVNADGETCLPYAVIRGNVVPVDKSLQPSATASPAEVVSTNNAKPLVASATSPIQQQQGVVRTYELIEHKTSLSRAGFWFDSKRVIHEYKNDVPFCLVAPALEQKLAGLPQTGSGSLRQSLLSPSSVEVSGWSSASRIHMDVVRDEFKETSGGIGDHIVGFFQGDRQKGIQTTECMLINGTTLTAVGELAVSNDDGKVRIQPPSNGRHYYLVKDTLKELTKDLESDSRILRILFYTFGGITTAFLVYAGYKFYKKRQAYQAATRNRRTLEDIVAERANREPQDADPEEAAAAAGEVPAAAPPAVEGAAAAAVEISCVVCLNQRREVILFECGHVCVCANCAMELMAANDRRKCPVCRTFIANVAPAYIP